MTSHEFTPAAERALAFAAQWWRPSATKSGNNSELGPAELLLGLLAEPECRAALLTAARGIDIDAVRIRWPEIEPAPPELHLREEELSAEVVEALHTAETHLVDFPPPHVLATEHLLWGLVAGRNEVARWLASLGWDAAQLAAEIDALVELDTGPLPFEIEENGQNAPAPAAAKKSTPITASRPASPPKPAGEKFVPLVTEPKAQTSTAHANAAHDEIARLRILDAAANRAGEAIRVIEDYSRFALDDRHLAGQCKSLRHEVTDVLSIFSAGRRHAARETQQDVGTTITLASEERRANLREVVAANFQRLEQALRSLEEYAKPTSPDAATRLEQLRYRAYTLERAIDITSDSLQRLARCRLYVLVDGCESVEALSRLVDQLIAAGADAIQLRDKNLPDRELLCRARAIRKQTRGTETLFIVNDRPDLARLAGADGVHVGQDELSVKDARAIVGPDALVGVSTHSLEQAIGAVLDGANYIGVGPTFPSRTKQFEQFPGLELLRAVAHEIRLPAFAIGGITAGNLAEVRAAGFERIAVSGAVTGSSSPADAVRELKSRLV